MRAGRGVRFLRSHRELRQPHRHAWSRQLREHPDLEASKDAWVTASDAEEGLCGYPPVGSLYDRRAFLALAHCVCDRTCANGAKRLRVHPRPIVFSRSWRVGASSGTSRTRTTRTVARPNASAVV